MKKYNIIYADPPWKYSSKQYQDGSRYMVTLEDKYYNTMTIDEMKLLPVNNIIDNNCICFMWVTDSHLKEGIEVIESWGFKYKTIGFNWIKTYSSGAYCVNFAPWTLKSWEICLIGIKGIMGKYKKTNNVRGLIFDERTEHSKKPEIVKQKIYELFGDLPRLELFARKKTDGWDVWGNEVESDIDLMSVAQQDVAPKV